jgi:hypothetical protein
MKYALSRFFLKLINSLLGIHFYNTEIEWLIIQK